MLSVDTSTYGQRDHCAQLNSMCLYELTMCHTIHPFQVAAMPTKERAMVWVRHVKAWAEYLLEMKGDANHPAARLLVSPQPSPSRTADPQCVPLPFGYSACDFPVVTMYPWYMLGILIAK